MNKYDKERLQRVVDWNTRKDFSTFETIQEYLDKQFNESVVKDDKEAKVHYELGACIALLQQLFSGYKDIEKIINE